MKRIDGIKAIVLEITHFERSDNANILWPLPDKLRQLLVLYHVQSENQEFLNHINEVCIEMLQNLIKDCTNCFGKNEEFVNLTVKQVKEYASKTMNKFRTTCDCFNEPMILDQEV